MHNVLYPTFFGRYSFHKCFVFFIVAPYNSNDVRTLYLYLLHHVDANLVYGTHARISVFEIKSSDNNWHIYIYIYK